MNNELLSLRNKYFDTVNKYIPGYQDHHHPGNAIITRMCSNENWVGPSPFVVNALLGCAANIANYPDNNYHELKHAIASLNCVEDKQVLIGCGSSEILDLIVRTLAAPHTIGITFKHAFILYKKLFAHNGLQVKLIHEDNDFTMNLEDIIKSMNAKTSIIIFANPNNPTGKYIVYDALEEFLYKIPHSTIVVVDEAYYEYMNSIDYDTAIKFIKVFPNLIVTRTLSKAYGLAGLRIGYCVANPHIIKVIEQGRIPFNLGEIQRIVALSAIKDQEHISRVKLLNAEGSRYLADHLKQFGINYLATAGNFITVNFGKEAKILFESLLNAGILTRYLSPYDMHDYLRLTVRDMNTNKKFIAHIHEFINKTKI